MPSLIVLENPAEWGFQLAGADVVAARDYVASDHRNHRRGTRVFNLCRAYGYQSLGYYVSLLAEARGHKPLPSAGTVQDLRSAPILKIASADLDSLIQRNLASIRSDTFELSIYFGRNLAKRYDRLCQALFDQFPVPLLRATFHRKDKWRLHRIVPIAAGDIPRAHHGFVVARAERYFARPKPARKPKVFRYELAILTGSDPASDPPAISRFCNAAEELGIHASVIDSGAFGRLAEFDALFIRETTAVNHYTFRFSRRADAERMVVIDDPSSIIRCTNKVYLAELFARHNINHPRTVVVGREARVTLPDVGYPCIVKKPDSSFSRGVYKANDPAELKAHLASVLDDSELALVQEYVPSEFDWRVGVLGRQVLYACRYHMARGDWRIQAADANGKLRYGKVDPVPISDVPPEALSLAIRATQPIGDGLYGVDIKESRGRFCVIEVNDNPSILAGYEDAIGKSELYRRVMQHFLLKLEARGHNV